VGAEAAGRDLDAARAERLDELLDQWFGDLGWRGAGEGGPPTSACVAVEGELRDDEDCATGVFERTIEAALFVGEDADGRELGRQPVDFVASIIGANADVEE